jgi:predicted acylesterase/phospholipase RssA
MEDAVSPLKPFQNIAIAFSGGGFRAAAYSLGALTYLNSLKIEGKSLLERISFVSSASGGTITAMSYTAQRQKSIGFEAFFNDLLLHLSGESLLEEVLTTLNDDTSWSNPATQKQRNLINSFAKVYDKTIFKGETLEVYFNKNYHQGMEVCFNTTEFYRGLSFRFQTSGTSDKRQVIGNNYLWFDNNHLEVFKSIKLADILAASSCFPMGFEPIVFPEDFSYNDSESKTLSVQQLRSAMHYENYSEESFSLDEGSSLDSFGFMDGGITDNQGLSSLMLADKKRQKRAKPNPFDLIIVTDVASYFMDSYDPPILDKHLGWRENTIGRYTIVPEELLTKVKTWQSAALAATIVFFVIACLFDSSWIRLPATAFAAVSITLYLAILLAKRSSTGKAIIAKLSHFDLKQFLFANFRLERTFSGSIIDKLIGYLKLTKLGVFEQMIKARISSVMIMVTDVNLKQVRRLIYEKFYNDPCWDDRRVPNFIYELSSHNRITRQRRFESKGRLKWVATDADKQLLVEGLENLQPIAEEARTTGTTLWFDQSQTKNETLKKIVTTGQFSICANLLEYITSLERRKVKYDAIYESEIKAIKAILEADFRRFKAAPYFLYDQLKTSDFQSSEKTL